MTNVHVFGAFASSITGDATANSITNLAGLLPLLVLAIISITMIGLMVGLFSATGQMLSSNNETEVAIKRTINTLADLEESKFSAMKDQKLDRLPVWYSKSSGNVPQNPSPFREKVL